MTTITTPEVRSLMRTYIDSVALNTALELGLFWRLADRAQSSDQVAEALGIPPERCACWLELLTGMGFLAKRGGRYAPSTSACAAILDAFEQDTWQHLAEEERLRYAFGVNLSQHIGHPLSVWAGQNRMPHNYLSQIAQDPGFARRFTRMLYELHLPLAETVAATLDMTRVHRLMDLGGGSGVISLALLRRHPELTAVVVDHPHVCAAGREIAATLPEGERLTFQAADFMRDELPAGCDMALECDVAIYNEAFYHRVWLALNEGGRLVVVDDFESTQCATNRARQRYAFYEAATGRWPTDAVRPSISRVQSLLARAGFQLSVEHSLGDGEFILQGRK